MEKTAEAIELLENTIKAQREVTDAGVAEGLELGSDEAAIAGLGVDLHLVNICAEMCMAVGLWERAATIIQQCEKCK